MSRPLEQGGIHEGERERDNINEVLLYCTINVHTACSVLHRPWVRHWTVVTRAESNNRAKVLAPPNSCIKRNLSTEGTLGQYPSNNCSLQLTSAKVSVLVLAGGMSVLSSKNVFAVSATSPCDKNC